MKTKYVSLFMAIVFFPLLTFAQIGMTQGEKIEPYRAQSGVGFDQGTNSKSAKEQLEEISGQKISTPNTRYTQPQQSQPKKQAPPAFNANTYIKQELTKGLVQGLINFLFTDNSKADEQKKLQQQREAAIAAAKAAAAAAEARRIKDSIDQAKYTKMMQSYKLLDAPSSIGIKKLTDNNGLKIKNINDITLKTIPLMGGAPLSERDRFYQKHKIQYDFTAMNSVGSERLLKDDSNTPEEDVNEKFLEAWFEKIESFQGGKLAVFTGKIMLNISKQTFSYLKDASNAIVKGDVEQMQELAQKGPATIVKNALIDYGVDEIKSKVTDYVTAIPTKLGVKCMNLYTPKGGEVLENVLDAHGKATEAWGTIQLIKDVRENNK